VALALSDHLAHYAILPIYGIGRSLEDRSEELLADAENRSVDGGS